MSVISKLIMNTYFYKVSSINFSSTCIIYNKVIGAVVDVQFEG